MSTSDQICTVSKFSLAPHSDGLWTTGCENKAGIIAAQFSSPSKLGERLGRLHRAVDGNCPCSAPGCNFTLGKELGWKSQTHQPAIPCSQPGEVGNGWEQHPADLLASCSQNPAKAGPDLSGNHCQQRGGPHMEGESTPPPSCSHSPHS